MTKKTGEAMDGIRAEARRLLEGVLPFKIGDPSYSEVCKGFRHGKGAGTSCTWLPNWMMWKLGVSAQNNTKNGAGTRTLLNWDDKELGTKLIYGEGIMAIRNSEAFVKTFFGIGNRKIPNRIQIGDRPRCGDVVFINGHPDGPQWTEHVFVFIEPTLGADGSELWRAGQSGQQSAEATTGIEANIGTYRIVPADDTGVPRVTPPIGVPSVSAWKKSRAIVGWLDIGKLDYVA